MNRISGLTSIFLAMSSSLSSVLSDPARRSSNMSPIATSFAGGSARSACEAAPVPRPPQPIRPTRIVSAPAAWTCGTTIAAPAMAADVVKKSRRDSPGDWFGMAGTSAGVGSGEFGNSREGRCFICPRSAGECQAPP